MIWTHTLICILSLLLEHIWICMCAVTWSSHILPFKLYTLYMINIAWKIALRSWISVFWIHARAPWDSPFPFLLMYTKRIGFYGYEHAIKPKVPSLILFFVSTYKRARSVTTHCVLFHSLFCVSFKPFFCWYNMIS